MFHEYAGLYRSTARVKVIIFIQQEGKPAMPLTDLISFEGVLMSGFSRKGEQILKSFK